MASRILSQDEARARRGPMEGPQRVNNEALTEEDAASTTDPIESFSAEGQRVGANCAKMFVTGDGLGLRV